MNVAPISPAFERLGPAGAPTPLVIAVPHAGRTYPAALLAASAVPAALLQTLEDRHADRLIGPAVAAGAVAIVARAARAWIDLNRAEDDLDPELRDPPGANPPPGARARAGLGLVPRRIGGRTLWRRPPDRADVAARVAEVHRPYHDAIAAALAAAVARHGHAVLIDCHSMPPLGGARAARVVIGDLHGRSAAPAVTAAAIAAARATGVATALNRPYAGAHGIDRHGRPHLGIHALQVEVDRTLYLARDMLSVGAGLEAAAALVATIAWTATAAGGTALAMAAE